MLLKNNVTKNRYDQNTVLGSESILYIFQQDFTQLYIPDFSKKSSRAYKNIFLANLPLIRKDADKVGSLKNAII